MRTSPAPDPGGKELAMALTEAMSWGAPPFFPSVRGPYRLLYPAKLSFRMVGQIKCFSDKVKLKEFIITKPLLYEMLKGLT